MAPEPRSWLELDAEARADRLLEACGEPGRFLRLQDARLRFLELGPRGLLGASVAGELPWVFIHGLGGGLGDFAPVLVSAGARHRVIAADLPGFGESVSSSGDYSIPAYVHTLRLFTSALGIERAHFVCHSLGGQVCLALAIEAPSLVASLTLVDSAGSYDTKEFLERVTGGALGSIRPQRDPLISSLVMSDGFDIVKRMMGNEPFSLAALGSFRDNYRGRVRELRVPTLVIWGSDDPLFPVDYAFFIKENVEGARLRVVPGAGHTPQLSDPDLVLSWLTQFHQETEASP